MRCGGDVRVSQVCVWVAAAESEHGNAYGETFGSSHPHDFHAAAGSSLSAREAQFQAVLRLLAIVPQDLTLYVVCTAQCQLDLHMRLHAWARDNWRQRDGTPILGKDTFVALYERLEDRTTQMYWRPWSAASINRRYRELLELLQIGPGLARLPDPPPQPPEQQALQRPPGRESQDRPAIQESMASVSPESTMYSATQPLSPLTLPSTGDEALLPPSPVYSNARTLTPQPSPRSQARSITSPSSVYSNVKSLTPQSSLFSNVRSLTPQSSIYSNVRNLTPDSGDTESARHKPRITESVLASARPWPPPVEPARLEGAGGGGGASANQETIIPVSKSSGRSIPETHVTPCHSSSN